MGDTMREAFERWYWAIDPDDRPDATDSWVVWCSAHEAGRQLGMEQSNALGQMANDAAERKLYERITPTQQAGDSDTKEN